MRLRNKKTGELSTRLDVNEDGDVLWVLGKNPCMYETLAELNAEWEDYEPQEPLIKDEKIRKAVRAWADAEAIPLEKTVFYNAGEYSFSWYRSVIEFSEKIQDLEENEYTITELCGEE